ncbi:MAG: hypothetical protein K2V38_16605 [Gemmataceae bacterium]|nr:hypothetical protein [Gemmataceae bacterium]
MVVEKAFMVVEKPFMVVEKAFMVVVKAFVVVVKGFAVVEKGFAVVEKGFAVVWKGFVVVGNRLWVGVRNPALESRATRNFSIELRALGVSVVKASSPLFPVVRRVPPWCNSVGRTVSDFGGRRGPSLTLGVRSFAMSGLLCALGGSVVKAIRFLAGASGS